MLTFNQFSTMPQYAMETAAILRLLYEAYKEGYETGSQHTRLQEIDVVTHAIEGDYHLN